MGFSPAFSFYAKDFLTGTATMTLAERGAYVSLLAYQWDSGAVPDSARERTRILGCTAAEERKVWARLKSKFAAVGDSYQNARLEEERGKQVERRRRLSDNGKQGGRPAKPTAKQNETNSFPLGKADGNLNERLASSSSFSSSRDQEVIESPTTKHRGVGVIVGGGEYVRLLESHAFVGQKLRVPKVLHSELMAKSGANADEELRKWYASLDERLEAAGKGTGDVFEWLRPRHQAYAKHMGWIEEAPKNGVAAVDQAARMDRLEKIYRGEIKR